MRAIKVHQHGGPEVLQLEELPRPVLKPNEVLVKNSYLGINFVDTQHRSGENYPIELPFIPGIEAVGTIVEASQDVLDFELGQRVGYAGFMGGNYAGYTAVPADQLIPLPDSISDQQAAASMLQGMTAHCLSENVYPIQREDTVLIHGGAGGVGCFLVQMAKNRGARVITTVSNQEKAAVARSLGADHVINYLRQDFESEVDKIAPEGIEVIYDSVGKATFDKGLNLLKAKGHMVIFGLSSGAIPPFDINRLSGITGAKSRGSLYLTWATLSDYNATQTERLDRAQELFQWISEGKVQPLIHAILPFEEIGRAHELLESRKVSGKILIKV